MIPEFQLDEFINSKAIFKKCLNQGLAKPIRFPRELDGKSDEELLPLVLAGNRALITCDREIANLHPGSIPSPHPGIIVIARSRGYPSLTETAILAVLDNFKGRFPQWCSISWTNSIVRISPKSVQVSRVIKQLVVVQIEIDYGDPSFAHQLEIALKANTLSLVPP